VKPLTFVTSIFGMTNMQAEPAPFWPFIIGFLSTKYGYSMWAAKTAQFWRWLRPKKEEDDPNADDWEKPAHVNRTLSTEEGMRLRLKNQPMHHRRRSSNRPAPSHPNIQRMVERMGEGRKSGLTRMGTVVGDDEKTENGSTGKDTVVDIRDV
jgi:hypothetical protein